MPYLLKPVYTFYHAVTTSFSLFFIPTCKNRIKFLVAPPVLSCVT